MIADEDSYATSKQRWRLLKTFMLVETVIQLQNKDDGWWRFLFNFKTKLMASEDFYTGEDSYATSKQSCKLLWKFKTKMMAIENFYATSKQNLRTELSKCSKVKKMLTYFTEIITKILYTILNRIQRWNEIQLL